VRSAENPCSEQSETEKPLTTIRKANIVEDEGSLTNAETILVTKLLGILLTLDLFA